MNDHSIRRYLKALLISFAALAVVALIGLSIEPDKEAPGEKK